MYIKAFTLIKFEVFHTYVSLIALCILIVYEAEIWLAAQSQMADSAQSRILLYFTFSVSAFERRCDISTFLNLYDDIGDENHKFSESMSSRLTNLITLTTLTTYHPG